MRRKSFLALAVSVLALSACASSGSTGGPAATVTESSPDRVTAAEISATSANSAFDLIRRLRPRWLQSTSPGSISGGVTSQAIIVYLDDTKLGSMEALRTLSASGIMSMQYYDAVRAATILRDIGSTPIAGAIVIRTR